MARLSMKKSTETYMEQNAIELSYYNVVDNGEVIGKMKADYSTMTRRTFSGVATINGVEVSVNNKKSMKEVLAFFEEMCFNSVVVESTATSELTTA